MCACVRARGDRSGGNQRAPDLLLGDFSLAASVLGQDGSFSLDSSSWELVQRSSGL